LGITDDNDDDDDCVAMSSLTGIIPPKVDQCPSQSGNDRRLVFTTSDMMAIVPKPDVRFLTGDGLQTLSHTCSHYGNASTNHSFALGTHHILCTARDRRSNAVAHCQFDIYVIGTTYTLFLCFFVFWTRKRVSNRYQRCCCASSWGCCYPIFKVLRLCRFSTDRCEIFHTYQRQYSASSYRGGFLTWALIN